MNDTISRQAALKVIGRLYVKQYANTDPFYEGWNASLDMAKEAIEQLPPVQPERIRGRWIESDAQNILMKNFIEKGETWRVCDKCGAGFMIGYQYESDKIYHETFHNFCPKCGAEMEVTT